MTINIRLTTITNRMMDFLFFCMFFLSNRLSESAGRIS